MAQQVLVQLVDDLDGTASDDIATVHFGLDGVAYEIDLRAANADHMRDMLAGYVASGRRTGGRVRRGVHPTNGSKTSTNGEARQIREWAQANGIDLAARGRIPGHVVDSYRAAQDDSAKAAAPKRRSRAKRRS